MSGRRDIVVYTTTEGHEGSANAQSNSTDLEILIQNSTAYYDHLNPGTPFDIAMDYLLYSVLGASACLFMVLCYHEILMARNKRVLNKRNRKCQIAPVLRALCILSAFFCLMRCINDIIYYKTSKMDNISCTLIKNIGASWLLEVDTTVYLFLWFRQRVIGSKQAMKTFKNAFITLANWASLALIVTIFLVLNLLLLWKTYSYNYEKQKCVKNYSFVNKVMANLWTVTSTILHILLVGLFAYPLIRQQIRNKYGTRSPPGGPKTDVPTTSSPLRSNKRRESLNSRKSLMAIVNRCIIISLICVLSDGMVVVITNYWITEDYQTKLRHFIYNTNVLLNSFCIVMSFKKWREMLFPCCTCIRGADVSETTKTNVGQTAVKRDSTTTTTVISTNLKNQI